MADIVTLNDAAEFLAININRVLMARAMGQTAYHGDRDYYEVLGYPTDITITDYLGRYERQNIASRIVDLPASDSWKKPPKISEDDEEETEFVKAWIQLNKRLGVYNVLSRADKLSGIGRFGVIFIGLRDGANPDQPVSVKEVDSEEDVLFLRPFSEYHVDIESWDEDSASSRYGMPLKYKLSVKDHGDPITVHWERILHLADNKLDSEVYGVPRLRPVFNLLDDLMKITGGTAEATWLNMRPGVMVSPDEGYKWDDTTEAETEFLEEVKRYAHDPLRMLRLVGLKAETIGASQVLDPQGPYDVTLSLIASSTGIPQRVLTGSAAGELASAKEDNRQWAQFIANRQTNYVGPEILRPFIDMLIDYGALPTPVGGSDAYDVGTLDSDGARSWPSIIELSEQERAEAVNSQATAVKSLADPLNMTLPITVAEQRKLLGFPEKPEGEQEPPEIEDTGALAMAIRNYRAGQINAEQLARFAIENLADGTMMTQAEKKAGPGKGWWGPPRGTHTGIEAGDVSAYGNAPYFAVRELHMKNYLAGKYPTDVYHITDTDSVMAIAQQGLIPAAAPPPGQSWEAEHSPYATYFHVDKAAADNNFREMSSGYRAMIVAKLPKDRDMAHRIIPDEEAYPTPSDGMRALKEKSPIAVIAGLEREHISGFVLDKGALPDSDIAELRSAGFEVDIRGE